MDLFLNPQTNEAPVNAQEQQQAMGKIIAKAWADEAYKLRLIHNPADVLKEEGLPVPEGITVKVVENTPALFHVILPRNPGGELTDEDLDATAGGLVNLALCSSY